MPDSIRISSIALLAAALAAFVAVPTQAQTPTTTIQNGNADTRLQLNYDGGFYVPGTYDPKTPADSIPAIGAGTRLMWYPAKAAFRAGEVTTRRSTAWNAGNIGFKSMAFGSDVQANGLSSTAMGEETTASGSYSTAMGVSTTASGVYSVAMGNHTIADERTSLSFGQCNSANQSSDNTLLVAGSGSGNATGCDSRADALVLKKDGDLAVGPSDPQDLRLHVSKDKANAGVSDSPGANMVLFENTNTGTKPDVLGLQAGPTDPGSGVTYVSFYQRDGTTIGSIEGNSSGGVNLNTSGSDYAEELPVSGGATAPEPTDLVGVRGGTASLRAEGAGRVMIASDRPAVTGNTTPSTEADDARRVAVAFVGQVPAKVRGDADVGDLIVPSGKNDGTAQAVAPSDYRRATHGPIAGQAWSAKSTSKVGEVTVAVGLGRSGAVAEQLEEQRAKIQDMENRLAALEAERSPSKIAGLTGSGTGLFLAFLLGGLFGAGVLWRRRN